VTTAAPPGLDPVVTWGVPFNYFRRLLHFIFRARQKNFNGTADTCTFVDPALALFLAILARSSAGSARIRVSSALHLVDHNIPHVDIELELMLQRRLGGIDKRQVGFHLAHQCPHSLDIVTQGLRIIGACVRQLTDLRIFCRSGRAGLRTGRL
jgi:hypothetical protein